MRIAFVINDFATEKPEYTTTALAMTALRRGHLVWTLTVSDFACTDNGSVHARARRAPRADYESAASYLAEVGGPTAHVEDVRIHDLDVLFLRNDPAAEVSRPWARRSAVTFGRLAAGRGVLVVNDPHGLAMAEGKEYLHYFPEALRPRTLICRDPERIKLFVEELEGRVVLKPLTGSGGQSVFVIRNHDSDNLNQIIEAVGRDGYVITQEYLPAAEKGDLRLFMLNAQPLQRNGKVALFRRLLGPNDLRSNIRTGGRIAPAVPDERVFRLAEMVRPRLVADGMFLVGLDIAGDKLTEINVFTPGGLGSARKLYGVDFCEPVIEALERKVQNVSYYHRHFDNAEMSTL